MREIEFGEAIDRAIDDAMVRDPSIVLMGEDAPLLRASLLARHGDDRVLNMPISESACLGAAVTAALGGLRPIVELYMVDFVAVGFDAVLNHMAKQATYSGGDWPAPVLVRAPSGGGYGDGGQHGQSLWGMLAAIPGLTVAVPSTPADAYGLATAALNHEGPVILLEPKLLSQTWLEFLGRCGRETVQFDVPPAGARGPLPDPPEMIALGRGAIRREGADVTVCSVAVGVHRALQAAETLKVEGIDCEVIDLRSLRPLDRDMVVTSAAKTGKLVVVDEDYRDYGLSGELAASVLEAGLAAKFGRVCLEDTLPYARELERAALPNPDRICEMVRGLVSDARHRQR